MHKGGYSNWRKIRKEHTRTVQPPATAHPILWASQCDPDESQKLLWSMSSVSWETEQDILMISLLSYIIAGRRMFGRRPVRRRDQVEGFKCCVCVVFIWAQMLNGWRRLSAWRCCIRVSVFTRPSERVNMRPEGCIHTTYAGRAIHLSGSLAFGFFVCTLQLYGVQGFLYKEI